MQGFQRGFQFIESCSGMALYRWTLASPLARCILLLAGDVLHRHRLRIR